MCRHIYNWVIVACDVKKPISNRYDAHITEFIPPENQTAEGLPTTIRVAMTSTTTVVGKVAKVYSFPLVRLGYCFTPYQRLRLYNVTPFSRLLRHAGDTEDVFLA